MTSGSDFDQCASTDAGDRRIGAATPARDAQAARPPDHVGPFTGPHASLNLDELLARLRFWGQPVAFRNRRYRLLPGAEGVGMVPGGVLHWQDTASEGIAFVVRDQNGTPINLLHVGCGAAIRTNAEFLVGEPIWGGRISFRGLGARRSPTVFTDCWHEALTLWTATGYTAIACLCLEAVVPVAREWANDNPEAALHICYSGGAAESDNPELVELFKIHESTTCRAPEKGHTGAGKAAPGKQKGVVAVKKPLPTSRALLIPAGEGLTFGTLAARDGLEGLRQHLRTQRAEQHPFPLNQRHPALEVVPLPSRWPTSVSGEYVLRTLQAALRKYVALTEPASFVIALWIVLSYAGKKIRHMPILSITSPEYGCGKTTLLFVMQFLCARALGLSATEFPALMRTLKADGKEAHRERTDYQTLLLDEAQHLFRNVSALARIEAAFDSFELGVLAQEKERLARLHRRGACVLAYWGASPPIRIACRSINVRVQRQDSSEFTEPQEGICSAMEQGELTLVRSMIRRLAEDVFNEPADVAPMRSGVRDARLEDVWRPMLQLARAISADTERRLRLAAADFILEPEEVIVGRELLSNVREILAADLLPTYFRSEVLAAQLRDNAAWLWQARKLDHLELTRMLRPYGPQTTFRRHEPGKKPFHAFERLALEAAANRYLPAVE